MQTDVFVLHVVNPHPIPDYRPIRKHGPYCSSWPVAK
jgi:hypothetical protein